MDTSCLACRHDAMWQWVRQKSCLPVEWEAANSGCAVLHVAKKALSPAESRWAPLSLAEPSLQLPGLECSKQNRWLRRSCLMFCFFVCMCPLCSSSVGWYPLVKQDQKTPTIEMYISPLLILLWPFGFTPSQLENRGRDKKMIRVESWAPGVELHCPPSIIPQQKHE